MNRTVNIMTWVFALALVAGALMSCGFTDEGDIVRTAVSEKGAQAMDQGLTNAEWFICRAASVGAIRRRYGSDPVRAEAYRVLCSDDLEIRIITAPEPVE